MLYHLEKNVVTNFSRSIFYTYLTNYLNVIIPFWSLSDNHMHVDLDLHDKLYRLTFRQAFFQIVVGFIIIEIQHFP